MDKVEQKTNDELGFGWWKAWAWLGLTIGNLYILGTLGPISKGFAWAWLALNTITCILILRMNKYAFLWATILSLNPLIWIINGVYLKRRWRHPSLNSVASGSKSNDFNRMTM
jgi:hypothetical protein